MRGQGRGPALVACLIACGAAACVVALVALPRGAPAALLCSDERCGEGSKLSRDNAVKDLDKYADKAELKDRLDELQTVMERGMTHKDEVRQLNSYFGNLERTVQTQRRHALRQAQSEGLDSPVLSASRLGAAMPSLHTRHSERTTGGGNAVVQAAQADGAAEQPAHRYFDRQARRIRDENRGQLHSSKLSASEAQADLNAYFDSLKAHTQKAKMHSVVKRLDKLTSEVHNPKDTAISMREGTENTRSSLKTTEARNRDIKDDSKRGLTYDRRASSAQPRTHAHRQPAASVSKAHPAPKENPRIKMFGLPPGWEAYEDENTKFPYFYNAKTGKSTWVNPEGTAVAAKGLPSGWGAFKGAKGQPYFANEDTGEASFNDPRVAPGAKVLALIHQVDSARSRLAASKEETAKLAAVSADHGVFGHTWPRSQWADRGWMKFLTSSNARGMGSILTNGQQLREGMMGSQHAALQPVASSSY